MKQEDKELLIKDLCARLPYKPKALVNGHLATILGIDENVVIVCIDGNDYKDETVVSAYDNGDDIKPYLRPMSSMTEEDKRYLMSLKYQPSALDWKNLIISSQEIIDFLNRKMFDYRGLIPLGLALEAPNV